MVGSPAAEDAIARARRLPSLKIGLHVTVVRGKPVLPPEHIPDLVDPDGMLPRDLFRAGVRFAFHGRVRRQLAAEIRAQFEAFQRSGLPMDHVDAHNHMHYHPTVLRLILEIGREYGVRAVRIPHEPLLPSWRAAERHGIAARMAWSLFLGPWLSLMRARVRRTGLATNDAMFGMSDSGHMTLDRVLAILRELPDGVSEIYFHPAAVEWNEGDPLTEGYEREGELAALTSPEVAAALRKYGIECTTFCEIAR